MATLYIARHGNTFDPSEMPRRIGRRTDLSLSASGRKQADRLGEYFAESNISFSVLFAAPLKRTMETAAAIASQQKTPPSVALEASLLEIDYGSDDGKTEAEVIARIGEDAVKKWNDDAIPPPGWNVDAKALTESWRKLFARIAAIAPGAVALAVTSNGVARFALDAATNVDPAFPRKLRTGAYGRIDINDNNTTVAQWDMRP